MNGPETVRGEIMVGILNMLGVESGKAVVKRVVIGAIAGTVIGLVVQAVLSDGPPADRWVLFIGPSVGAICIGFAAAVAGSWEVRGRFKIMAITTLAGLALGTIGGTIVYPSIMVGVAGDEKAHAYYANKGAAVGIPVGTIAGTVLGLVACVLRQYQSRMPRGPE